MKQETNAIQVLVGLQQINSVMARYDASIRSKMAKIVYDLHASPNEPSQPPPQVDSKKPTRPPANPAPAPVNEFELAELMESLAPSSSQDRVKVVAYYIQECEGKKSFNSIQINDHLLAHGFNVNNISAALWKLMNKQPAMVMRVPRSHGADVKNKRTIHSYRLTHECLVQIKKLLLK